MRQKFKAWDKTKKRWIGGPTDHLRYVCVCDEVVVIVKYGVNPNISMGDYIPVSCEQLTWPEVENLEIVQFTGFKDMENEEIWSGDIVSGEYCCPICFDDQPHRITGTIEWDESAGIWMFDFGHGGMPLSDENLTNLKILGHICENPELLETENGNSN